MFPLMGVTRVYNAPDLTFSEIVVAKLCLAAAVSNNIKNLLLVIDNLAAMTTIHDALIYEIKDSPSLQSMSDKYHATAIFQDLQRLSTSFNYLTIVWQLHMSQIHLKIIFSHILTQLLTHCAVRSWSQLLGPWGSHPTLIKATILTTD